MRHASHATTLLCRRNRFACSHGTYTPQATDGFVYSTILEFAMLFNWCFGPHCLGMWTMWVLFYVLLGWSFWNVWKPPRTVLRLKDARPSGSRLNVVFFPSLSKTFSAKTSFKGETLFDSAYICWDWFLCVLPICSPRKQMSSVPMQHDGRHRFRMM